MLQNTLQLSVSGNAAHLPELFLEKLKILLAEVDISATYTLFVKPQRGQSQRSRNVAILETYENSIKFMVYGRISTLSWQCLLAWEAKRSLREEIIQYLTRGTLPSSTAYQALQTVLPKQAALKKLPVKFMSVGNGKDASPFIARLIELYPKRIISKEYARALLIAEFGYKNNVGAGTAWSALVRRGYASSVAGGLYEVHPALLPRKHPLISADECDILESQLKRLTDLALFRGCGINRTVLRDEVRAEEEACARILKKLRGLSKNPPTVRP